MGIINLSDNKTENVFVSCIIAAAGSSLRMGVNKQFIELDGEKVLMRSVRVFEETPCIDEIIISARKEDAELINRLVEECGFKKVRAVCEGGSTRQISVQNAVAFCKKQTGLIVIHDGARPLVTKETIEKTVASALENSAAACAVRVKDTIKVADESAFISSTPDRSTLWAVQTPQVFDFELYLKALESASADMTDDCRIIEAAGGRVKLVEGEYTNIKITTPEDIILAEAILKARK